MVVVSEQSIY